MDIGRLGESINSISNNDDIYLYILSVYIFKVLKILDSVNNPEIKRILTIGNDSTKISVGGNTLALINTKEILIGGKYDISSRLIEKSGNTSQEFFTT